MLICAWCLEQVIPKKNFDWFIFIVLLLVGVLGGIAYMVYWASKPTTVCPLCDWDVYGQLKTEMWGGDRVVLVGGNHYRPDAPNLEERIRADARARARQRKGLSSLAPETATFPSTVTAAQPTESLPAVSAATASSETDPAKSYTGKDDREGALYLVTLSHTPERCPEISPEISGRLAWISENLGDALKAHGCVYWGCWAAKSQHRIYLVLDAPHAHAVDAVIAASGFAAWNTGEIAPLITLSEAVSNSPC